MTLPCPAGAAVPEPGAWGARNRVELYPGKWQTWVLARATDRDVPSDLEVRKMARAVMAKWFGETPVLDAGNSAGSADLIEVGQPSRTPIELRLTLQTAKTLPGPTPLLKPGGLLYVPVRFVWRAQSETSRPWPTWRVNWGMGGPCPVEADWILYAVGSDQAELQPAAPEQPMSEKVGESLNELGSGVKLVGLGLLLFGVGYVVTAFRPSRG